MKRKKFLMVLMAATLTAASPVGIMAASTSTTREISDAVIDTTKTGTVTLHKLIENSGYQSEADGMGNDVRYDESTGTYAIQEASGTTAKNKASAYTGTDGYTAVDKIFFSYKKIADIVNVADTTQVGTYFANLDADFQKLAKLYGADMTGHTVAGTVYYTTDQVEAMVDKINAATDAKSGGEVALTDYVRAHGTQMSATDTNGMTSASKLPLGLYLFGETNVAAHDGYDGADQYTGNLITTERDTLNPEAPIIESPASPFLVSLPTTEITGDGAGTTWVYNEDIYPKDQTTSIYKRIVDPDEKAEKDRNLRTSEDYQIGDKIEQVIYADVPKLQPGKTHQEYKITDTMTSTLTFDKITKVALGTKVDAPDTINDFASFTALDAGDWTVAPATGGSTWTITLTESGLKKLDTVGGRSQVVVYFDSTLNKTAKIGTDPSNENHPTLTWKNSNTVEHQVNGNRVYDFTYELDVTKTGIKNFSKVHFTVRRTDEDEFKNTVDVKFVKEGDGVYHVYDEKHGDQETDALTNITPGTTGKMNIKGLDSDRYTFKEIQTEAGKSLLKTTFDVTFSAKGRNNLQGEATAAITTPDTKTPQTLTCEKGIAKLTVNNYKAVTLRTGGEGRTMIYLMGASMAAGLGVLTAMKKRKEQKTEE